MANMADINQSGQRSRQPTRERGTWGGEKRREGASERASRQADGRGTVERAGGRERRKEPRRLRAHSQPATSGERDLCFSRAPPPCPPPGSAAEAETSPDRPCARNLQGAYRRASLELLRGAEAVSPRQLALPPPALKVLHKYCSAAHLVPRMMLEKATPTSPHHHPLTHIHTYTRARAPCTLFR